MREEREIYITPEMEVVEFEAEDVIVASNTVPDDPLDRSLLGIDY